MIVIKKKNNKVMFFFLIKIIIAFSLLLLNVLFISIIISKGNIKQLFDAIIVILITFIFTLIYNAGRKKEYSIKKSIYMVIIGFIYVYCIIFVLFIYNSKAICESIFSIVNYANYIFGSVIIFPIWCLPLMIFLIQWIIQDIKLLRKQE